MNACSASAREVELLFDRHVLAPWPQLASMPARSITPEVMRDVLARMIKAGIGRQTNIARSYLNAAFVHGAHADLDPRRAAAQASTFRLTSNPIQLLPRIAEFESARDRVLIDEELRQLWVTLEKRQDELGATIRCILLLGGQRFRKIGVGNARRHQCIGVHLFDHRRRETHPSHDHQRRDRCDRQSRVRLRVPPTSLATFAARQKLACGLSVYRATFERNC